MTPVKIYTNTEDGMSARVYNGKDNTFNVTLMDDDAGQAYTHIHGYKTLEAACAKAQEVMGPIPGSNGTVWAPVY